MKLISWIFNVTQRHRQTIVRYENGRALVRIVIVLISLIFAALTIGGEYLFLEWFYNPPQGGSDMGTHVAKLFGMGILTLAVAVATLDYAVCFAYVGLKNAILGDISTEEGFRIFDLLVGLIELALAIGLIVLMVALCLKFPVWFMGK